MTQTGHLPGWTERCAVQQTSLGSLWFLLSSHWSSFLSPFIFFHFHGPRSTDSFPLYHFTLSLFICFTLSHRWPLVTSRTPFRPSLFLFPASWFPLCFHVSVSGALLDIFCFALCCYLSEVKTGLHAYLRSSVASFWGLEGGYSTLQSCKTSPKPLVFPKVKHKKGCHFTLSCFISDLWCLMAFWRSQETTVPFLAVCVLVCLLSPWSHSSIFSKSTDDHISFIVSVLHRK